MIILIHCIPYRNSIPLTYRLHINRNPTSVILSNPYVNTLFITQSQICFCTQTIQHRQNQMLTRNSSLITTTLLFEGGNLAASKIRNLECPSYEICLIDYGCGKFNRKIHIMEQYP